MTEKANLLPCPFSKNVRWRSWNPPRRGKWSSSKLWPVASPFCIIIGEVGVDAYTKLYWKKFPSGFEEFHVFQLHFGSGESDSRWGELKSPVSKLCWCLGPTRSLRTTSLDAPTTSCRYRILLCYQGRSYRCSLVNFCYIGCHGFPWQIRGLFFQLEIGHPGQWDIFYPLLITVWVGGRL